MDGLVGQKRRSQNFHSESFFNFSIFLNFFFLYSLESFFSFSSLLHHSLSIKEVFITNPLHSYSNYTMLARAGLRTTSLVAKRGFTSSAIARSGGHHLPEGPYSNLPFKVHNRKIPYWAVHWTFFGTYI